MTTLSNEAPRLSFEQLRAIGATALANAQKASVTGLKARADMTFVILQSLQTDVHCYYQKADKTIVVNSFEPVTMLIEPAFVETICDDVGPAITAVNDAVIMALTGVDKPTTAQRDCYKAARDAAFGLVRKGGDAIADVVKRTSRGNLQVPYSIMHDAPKPDAPESAHDMWESRKNSLATIDGTRGNSFSELKSRVSIKKPSERPNAGQGKVQPVTLLETLKAKMGKAAWNGHKGMDWVAYLADLSGAELIEAAVLYSAHKGDAD